MLNHITIMGRLTSNPELRRTGSGVPITSFTLAVEDDFKTSDGNKKTIFVDFVAWRNTAEYVSRHFSKGRMAVVSGKLDIREWTDKDGNKRRSAEVVADNVYFGDSKKSDSYSGSVTDPASAIAPTGDPVQDFALVEDDDAQLPF